MPHADAVGNLEAQLVRMGGQAFRNAGYDGKGIRIAVFDGGFPMVDTHPAFKHLRDGHRIIYTWNFPRRKADVYGWNSHGTMTLSCIAGREGEVDLGLATGAEFLLARTEVNAEPAKEEVWWQMAVEWADRHGANIISSSLGYGKERHYTTDMDGTSLVARAATMAARKGILVCNSAGNEADSRQWRTIITPADADSVLCVGGIENSLSDYEHITFSSLGPSADGRQKPNVCAFGYARTANNSERKPYHYVPGTSFSCPLVAGFAACAWQATPGATAMDMLHAIERSADLYPYCDYAFGYGVPQATYFTGQKATPAPTFSIRDEGDALYVRATRTLAGTDIFYKERSPQGSIVRYGKMHIVLMDTMAFVRFPLQQGNTLVVNMGGYTDSLAATATGQGTWASLHMDEDGLPLYTRGREERDASSIIPSRWGSNARKTFDVAFLLGLNIATTADELENNFWSPQWGFSFRYLRAYSKCYRLGLGVSILRGYNRFNDRPLNALDATLPAAAAIASSDDVSTRRVRNTELELELFQRVRLLPLGLAGKGLHWDLGLWGSIGWQTYRIVADNQGANGMSSLDVRMRRPKALDDHRYNFGVSTRLTYDVIGLYARYRLNGIGSHPDAGKVYLPRLTVGLQLMF